MAAIEQPEFLPCWGPIGDTTNRDWIRKHIYTNLIVSHWQLMWELGTLTQAHLEVLAEQFFAGAIGRRFWSEARGPRLKAETSRRARRFTRILDRIYLDALTAGPPHDSGGGEETDGNGSKATPRPPERPGARLLVGIVFGVAGWRLLARRKANLAGSRPVGCRRYGRP